MRAWCLLALVAACGNEQGFGNGADPNRAPTTPSETTEPGVTTVEASDDQELWSDAWDLSGTVPTDVVIFGDTSDSMTDELLAMGANILRFTDRLDANSNLWHLMAVNGPDGCAVNGWMDASTPDFDALFAEAIVTKPADTSQDEMGLQNVARAIELTGPGGCNEGFLRPEALLHVIFISDENDESPGFETPGYWQGYVDAIVATKGDPDRVIVSAVAGDVPYGCYGAEPGFGYAEVVDATEGTFLSICGAWPDQLDTLADASVPWEIFPLSSLPIPSTIEVRVNQQLATGWTYDEAGNLVRFETDPPQTGDLVDITYEPAD